jgi:AcrR family transcriptional regulator
MSPRPYQLGKRRVGTDETRARVVEAARAILTDPGTPAFTVDAVSARADVARMTVYYQFKSKGGLLEALFDDLGSRANLQQLRTVFENPDAPAALDMLVAIFCRFWQSERILLRRLNALAALDSEVDQAISERGGWRREGIAEIVSRLKLGARSGEVVDLLHMLTSFETFDALATPGRSGPEIVSMTQRAARRLLS